MSSSYEYATDQIVIYIGFFLLVGGFVGNTLNIIIFTSLKTFRETSCAFYLTAASFANILHLLATLLSRILITGYNIDLTKTSSVLCKLRPFVATIAPLMAVSCMCFATLDQFASLTIRWRHISQRYVAWRLVTVTMIFWCLTNIPVIIYQNNYLSSSTNQWTCSMTNTDFAIYYTWVYTPFLLGFVQLLIRITFGLLAFVNVRSLAHRQTAIIRLERDKQITSMVLIEIIVNVILSLPFFIYYTYATYTSISNAGGLSLYLLLVYLTNILHYATFGVGFYIYCCSSSRFRKQLVYVLVGIHLKYWYRVGTHRNNNQVVPQSTINKTNSLIVETIELY